MKTTIPRCLRRGWLIGSDFKIAILKSPQIGSLRSNEWFR
jgi:hypothetical protein